MRTAIDSHLKAKSAKAKGGGGNNRSAGSSHEAKGPAGNVAKRVSELEKQLAGQAAENAALRKQLAGGAKDAPAEGASPGGEEADEVARLEKDIKVLESSIEQQRALGLEPNEPAQKKLESLREAKDLAKAAKPVDLKKLHWRYLEAKKKRDQAATAETELREELQKLQAKVDEASAKNNAAEAAFGEAEEAYQSAARKVGTTGKEANEVADDLHKLGKTLEAASGLDKSVLETVHAIWQKAKKVEPQPSKPNDNHAQHGDGAGKKDDDDDMDFEELQGKELEEIKKGISEASDSAGLWQVVQSKLKKKRKTCS